MEMYQTLWRQCALASRPLTPNFSGLCRLGLPLHPSTFLADAVCVTLTVLMMDSWFSVDYVRFVSPCPLLIVVASQTHFTVVDVSQVFFCYVSITDIHVFDYVTCEILVVHPNFHVYL